MTQVLPVDKEAAPTGDARYQALVEAMDEGFCIIELIVDARGRPVDFIYVEANPAFIKHTGLENAVGKNVRQLIPGYESHWLETFGRVARTGDPVRLVEEVAPLGRWFDVYAMRLGDAGSLRVAVLFKDITLKKRADDELRSLAAELSEQDRRKTEFLATLAHELRNPLAPIRNGLHVMRQAASDPAVLEKTREMMERQLAHMVRLIDDLLDIARVSSGKIELKKQRVALQAVVASAIEISTPLIEAAGHALVLRLPPDPVLLDADPIRLAQVLGNLLNNAAKYTPDGGRIELSAVRDGDDLVVSVTDSGVGIPPEALPQVFKMFAQVGRNMDWSQGGLGIGLSLVRGLAELHGGSVTASSAGAGLGSTFAVRLPWPDASVSVSVSASTAAAEESGLPAGDGNGKFNGSSNGAPGDREAASPARTFSVLVVDDNVDAAESLAMILELGGHTAHVAHDGNRALDMAGALRPEVIFLDIGMPGRNGYEVARELRRVGALPRPVLVALTGWGAEVDRARSRDAGFDHHLTKPCDISAVEQLLLALGLHDRATPGHPPGASADSLAR